MYRLRLGKLGRCCGWRFSHGSLEKIFVYRHTSHTHTNVMVGHSSHNGIELGHNTPLISLSLCSHFIFHPHNPGVTLPYNVPVHIHIYSTYHRLGRIKMFMGFFCCRQLAKLRIERGIRLYNALSWPVCYNQTDACFHGCWVVGYCRF